jgi:hypothetical protein
MYPLGSVQQSSEQNRLQSASRDVQYTPSAISLNRKSSRGSAPIVGRQERASRNRRIPPGRPETRTPHRGLGVRRSCGYWVRGDVQGHCRHGQPSLPVPHQQPRGDRHGLYAERPLASACSTTLRYAVLPILPYSIEQPTAAADASHGVVIDDHPLHHRGWSRSEPKPSEAEYASPEFASLVRVVAGELADVASAALRIIDPAADITILIFADAVCAAATGVADPQLRHDGAPTHADPPARCETARRRSE